MYSTKNCNPEAASLGICNECIHPSFIFGALYGHPLKEGKVRLEVDKTSFPSAIFLFFLKNYNKTSAGLNEKKNG